MEKEQGMKLRYIYVVIREGLDNEVTPLEAYDSEDKANEVAEEYGHCEIYSHSVQEIIFKDFS